MDGSTQAETARFKSHSDLESNTHFNSRNSNSFNNNSNEEAEIVKLLQEENEEIKKMLVQSKL
jgi:hypothetical protein